MSMSTNAAFATDVSPWIAGLRSPSPLRASKERFEDLIDIGTGASLLSFSFTSIHVCSLLYPRQPLSCALPAPFGMAIRAMMAATLSRLSNGTTTVAVVTLRVLPARLAGEPRSCGSVITALGSQAIPLLFPSPIVPTPWFISEPQLSWLMLPSAEANVRN